MKDPSKTNPFHALKNQAPEVVRAEQDRRWEHARVVYALGRLGLGSYKRRLLRRAVDLNGEGFLTWSLFDEEFPDFPLRLSANRLSSETKRNKHGEEKEVRPEPLHRDERAFHPQWFKKFLGLPFMRPYEELFNSLGEVTQLKPIGMVFPRKGFPQGLVVHNGDLYTFVSPQSGCHVYLGGGKKPMNLVVQSFQGLLDNIHKVQKWRPPTER